MRTDGETSKALRARELGVARSTLYYKPKKPDKDWQLKCQIEEVLREHPSYGSPRIALHLKQNKKPNLLITEYPSYENYIWVSDFTYIPFQNDTVYMTTVEDLFTRKIVGLSVYTTHAVQLVLSAFMNAIFTNARPAIFHSDNGSEYDSQIFIEALETVGVSISRSAPGCPWENGYQESFYDKFKIDLGDPSRFKTLGELVYAIYQTIWQYNNSRIHTSLKMSPTQFAIQTSAAYNSGNKDGV